MIIRRKLIEVALPLEAINAASAREKSIRHGHPSTLHLWWARRPLAAARAVIFAQMVDDPSSWPDLFKTEAAQERERKRLFKIIEDLVQWENTTNEKVLQAAREEIWVSWRRTCAENADHPRAKEWFDRTKLPAFHDPFAGGGSLPLEAQRLGLEAHASDLNPVAVLICKAMIEIPPKFAGRPPVNPATRKDQALFAREWKGAQGLAEDVRYYGTWMRDEAERRIGHLYPKLEITQKMTTDRQDLKPLLGRKLTVIAWLWVRTVRSPNPAFSQVDVPLAATFMLSTKPGKEAYVEPVINGGNYKFVVRVGKPRDPEHANRGTKLSQGAFRCLMSGSPFKYEYIDSEANKGRLSERLMAIVAEGDRGRVYLTPTEEQQEMARRARPTWKPDAPSRGTWASNAQGRRYGFETFGDYFSERQLVSLTTFSDLVGEAMERVRRDATANITRDDTLPLREGGTGATAYAEALATYLGLAASRASDAWSMLVGWRNGVEATRGTFARQAIQMVWDFAEANPFSQSCGNWSGACLDWIVKAVSALPAFGVGHATQSDATTQNLGWNTLISTDPPYYDNIGYADLSDFFYVWLRRSLRSTWPELFGTVAVPKAEELVASQYRHGGKEEAAAFFLRGMTGAMTRLAEQGHVAFPVSVYYAFKQSESDDEIGTASTGWDTFLDALIRSGFAISGTWPMRTERGGRSVSIGTNSLASSIILVCRRRAHDAVAVTRREFVAELKAELPDALARLRRSNIAPVDLAQAAIGPGMAVFTRYARVLDAKGEPISVREALALINEALDEVQTAQEGDFESETRWAITWFDQQGFETGKAGEANVLANARVTSTDGLEKAGLIAVKGDKVRLLRPKELPDDWDPADVSRQTVWEITHHLIRRLEAGGEAAAAELVAKLGSKTEVARELAYRLYTTCERKKRAAEAMSYNALVQSWPEIVRLARGGAQPHGQADLSFKE